MKRSTWLLVGDGMRVAIAATAMMLLATASTYAVTLTTLYHTGVDDFGNALGDFVDDPHYSIIGSPSGPLADETTPNDGFPIPPWLANDPGSRWISPPDIFGGNDANHNPGTYYYETRFQIPAHLDPTNAAVVGWWAMDDVGEQIRVNAAPIPNAPTQAFTGRTWFGFNSDSAAAAGGPLVNGANSLVFQLANGGGPTGLRVNSIYAEAAPMGTVRVPGLYNTGVDNNGLPLVPGSPDPHYTLVFAPLGTVLPATAVIAPPSPPWVQNTSSSQWIGPNNDISANGPEGDYFYEIQFDLTGLDPNSVVISGLWSVDNLDPGLGILLNGIPTGNNQAGSFPEMTRFDISVALGDAFLPGLNTLTFPVFNLPANNNPTGLRVDGLVAYARVIPEPTTLTLLALGLAGAQRLRRRR